jgi:hypothetical protein
MLWQKAWLETKFKVWLSPGVLWPSPWAWLRFFLAPR